MPGKVFNLKKGGAVVRIVRKKEERKTKPHQEFVKSIIQECTEWRPTKCTL